MPSVKGALWTAAIALAVIYLVGHTDMGKKYLGVSPAA